MRALFDGIRLALRAIARNPLRASLTVLGILIGVAAVVIVTGVGTGVRGSVASQIQAMGSNFVIVFPQSRQASGAHGAQGSGVRLTEEDGRAILRESTSIAAIAPNLRAAGQIVYGDKNWNTSVIGTTLSYFVVRDWAIARGTAWDSARRDHQIQGHPAGLERCDEPVRQRRPGWGHRPHRTLPVSRARRAQEQG